MANAADKTIAAVYPETAAYKWQFAPTTFTICFLQGRRVNRLTILLTQDSKLSTATLLMISIIKTLPIRISAASVSAWNKTPVVNITKSCKLYSYKFLRLACSNRILLNSTILYILWPQEEQRVALTSLGSVFHLKSRHNYLMKQSGTFVRLLTSVPAKSVVKSKLDRKWSFQCRAKVLRSNDRLRGTLTWGAYHLPELVGRVGLSANKPVK